MRRRLSARRHSRTRARPAYNRTVPIPINTNVFEFKVRVVVLRSRTYNVVRVLIG